MWLLNPIDQSCKPIKQISNVLSVYFAGNDADWSKKKKEKEKTDMFSQTSLVSSKWILQVITQHWEGVYLVR